MLTSGVIVAVVAGLSQRTPSAVHIIAALQREALPEAAGSVGDAGHEDEGDEERLEHE